MNKRPEYSMVETGKRIRMFRMEKNISVEQIRQYMQLESPQAIYKWEKGKCFPQADNLLALAKLFEVDATDIMVEKKCTGYFCFLTEIKRFICLKNKKFYGKHTTTTGVEVELLQEFCLDAGRI